MNPEKAMCYEEMREMLRYIGARLELEEQQHPGGGYLLAAFRQDIVDLAQRAMNGGYSHV